MKIHRFYFDQKIENDKLITVSDGPLFHQLKNVLRLRVGEQVELIDGHGYLKVKDL